MRKFLDELKAFAGGGNLIDLSIGFIIGAAFAGLVESFAKDIVMDTIAALGGAPDTSGLVLTLNGGKIHYGTFLGNVISFVIMATVLFLVVKGLKRAGMGNFRAQGQRECPYCREFVAVDAVRCRHCTSNIAAVIDGDEGAEERQPHPGV